jgi:transposase-like protein
MICKICGSDKLINNGKRKGVQCYLCKNCKHQFTSEFGRHTDKDVNMAVSLYSLGLSFRTIAALFYLSPPTILRWIRSYAEEHYEKPLPQGDIVVELDEMHHFIKSKKTNCGFGKHIVAQLDSLLTGNAAIEQAQRLKKC